jgi:hypothetical protein
VTDYVSPGSVGTGLDALGMAVKLNRYSDKARYKLKPWIVPAALDRLGDRRLTNEEQRIVVEATHLPDEVQWPGWWSVTIATQGEAGPNANRILMMRVR